MAITFPTTLDTFTEIDCDSTVLPKDRSNDHSDAIEALETKVGINSSADNTSLDYKLTNAASIDPGHLHNADSINVDATGFSGNLSGTDTDVQTALTTIDQLSITTSDWQAVSGAVTYVSDGGITHAYKCYSLYVAGDQTAILDEGQRIKLTNNSLTVYGIIMGVSTYDGGNDRTTIYVYTGSNYDIQNSAITNVYYSSLYKPSGFNVSKGHWQAFFSLNATAVATPGANSYNLVDATIAMPYGNFQAFVETNIKLTEAGATGLFFTGSVFFTQETATPSIGEAVWPFTTTSMKIGPVNTTNNNLDYFFSGSFEMGNATNGLAAGFYLYSSTASGIDTVTAGAVSLVMYPFYI